MVNRIITDLAVMDVTPEGLKVVEIAPRRDARGAAGEDRRAAALRRPRRPDRGRAKACGAGAPGVERQHGSSRRGEPKEISMRRRIYWLLPDLASARKTMDDLLLARIHEGHIHFIGPQDADMTGCIRPTCCRART